MTDGARIRCYDNDALERVGQHAARGRAERAARLGRQTPRLVQPELVGNSGIGGAGCGYGGIPGRGGPGTAVELGGPDHGGCSLIMILLRKLTVGEAHAVAHELMGEGARDARQHKGPGGVFQHAVMSATDEVGDVFGVAALRLVAAKRKIADAASEFDEAFGIRRITIFPPVCVLGRKVGEQEGAVGFPEDRARQKRNLGH